MTSEPIFQLIKLVGKTAPITKMINTTTSVVARYRIIVDKILPDKEPDTGLSSLASSDRRERVLNTPGNLFSKKNQIERHRLGLKNSFLYNILNNPPLKFANFTCKVHNLDVSVLPD